MQSTEFGIKLAILSSLVVACALVPGIEFLCRRFEVRRSGTRVTLRAVAVRRVWPLAPRASRPVVAVVVADQTLEVTAHVVYDLAWAVTGAPGGGTLPPIKSATSTYRLTVGEIEALNTK